MCLSHAFGFLRLIQEGAGEGAIHHTNLTCILAATETSKICVGTLTNITRNVIAPFFLHITPLHNKKGVGSVEVIGWFASLSGGV